MAKFGKYKADGSVERDATECALTGMAVSREDGSVTEKVKGTPFFYRVHGSQYGNMTDEARAKIADEAKALEKPQVTTVVKAVKSSEVKE